MPGEFGGFGMRDVEDFDRALVSSGICDEES